MYFCSDIKWWPRSLCICWSSGSVYSVQERRVCVYGDQDGQYTVTIQPCLLLLPPLWPTGPPPPHHFLLPRALTSQLLLQTITAASFSSTNSYWWCFSSFCSFSPSKKTRTHLSSNAPPTLDFLNIQVSPSLPSWLSTSPQSPSPLHPSPSKSPPQFPNFKSISVPTAQVDQTIALEKHNKDERDENDGNKEDADDIDDASAVSFEQRTNGEEDKSLFGIFPADPFLRVPLAVQIKKWYICSVHLFKFWYNKKNLFKFHYKAG